MINLIGLAAGLAGCILIMLWVWDEIHYDAFHENLNTLYRVAREDHGGSVPVQKANTPGPLAAALRDEFPEIIDACRFTTYPGPCLLSDGERLFREPGVILADPSFLG